ncbi:SDR family oxidoreductase [Hymenobacter elongatus]|uniref:SDR family oxidoreductase n=1 Tax=Hymenobacter elongatus TaxID=877208 RepID=A0A4Z0PHW4_9BACT|nr:SDR family oxidoreductase [Hymenobacter elongatus]TGE14713.1 SDR family oxidoreductase [Hymenobacter elongatus]
MILMTGATGHLGSATIEFLLQKLPASQIAALVRDASKAASLQAKGVDLRVGSYDDPAALDQAMRGVEKVLLIAGTDEDHRVQQHQNVADAARKAGVQWLGYISRTLKNRATMANQLMEGHFQTEDYIKANGLAYSLFRNVLYLDAVPQFVGLNVLDTGMYLPAGVGKVPFALRREMGEAIATVLAAGGGAKPVYQLTGSASYSFADVAAVLTELSGQTVKYTAAELPAFAQSLQARGLPDLVVQRIAGFLADIKNGQEDEVSPDLERLLGRKPATLREGLKELYQLR